MDGLSFPDGASFAFTLLDDTDDTTLENGRPIYSLLAQLGFRTTKTVWPLDTPPGEQGPYFAGETLQRPGYLSWVRKLAAQGFEIAFHNASMGSSRREKTLRALDFLEREVPGSLTLHCNHGQNRENLYWGRTRYGNPVLSRAYSLSMSLRGIPPMEGHVPDSDYFWGDVAHERFRYVRAFAYPRLDCSRIPPGRPFFDPEKPYVRRWFNTADAPDVEAFRRLLSRSAIDSLAAAGGWAVVSTHMGKGFCTGGRVDGEVEEILRYIASLNGWFVPVTELLDHLWRQLGSHTLRPTERLAMECRHALDLALPWLRPGARKAAALL